MAAAHLILMIGTRFIIAGTTPQILTDRCQYEVRGGRAASNQSVPRGRSDAVSTRYCSYGGADMAGTRYQSDMSVRGGRMAGSRPITGRHVYKMTRHMCAGVCQYEVAVCQYEVQCKLLEAVAGQSDTATCP